MTYGLATWDTEIQGFEVTVEAYITPPVRGARDSLGVPLEPDEGPEVQLKRATFSGDDLQAFDELPYQDNPWWIQGQPVIKVDLDALDQDTLDRLTEEALKAERDMATSAAEDKADAEREERLLREGGMD